MVPIREKVDMKKVKLSAYFSRTSILSTFFTVGMFRSITTYAGIPCFSISTLFMSVYLFHGLVPCVPFLTV